MQPQNTRRGFTLIELLVSIAVISLLGSIVLVSLSSVRKKARDTRRIQDFKNLIVALELFRAAEGRLPNNTDNDTGGFDVGNSSLVDPEGFIAELQTPPSGASILRMPIVESNGFSPSNSYRYYKYSPAESPAVDCVGTVAVFLVRLEQPQSTYRIGDTFADCPTYDGDIAPNNSDDWLLYVARQ